MDHKKPFRSIASILLIFLLAASFMMSIASASYVGYENPPSGSWSGDYDDSGHFDKISFPGGNLTEIHVWHGSYGGYYSVNTSAAVYNFSGSNPDKLVAQTDYISIDTHAIGIANYTFAANTWLPPGDYMFGFIADHTLYWWYVGTGGPVVTGYMLNNAGNMNFPSTWTGTTHYNGGNGQYLYKMTMNYTSWFPQFAITATAGSHGSVSPSGVTNVNYGSNQGYTITPDAGYHIVDVLVDGSSQGAVDSYTFTSVTTTHTISATFAINTGVIVGTQPPASGDWNIIVDTIVNAYSSLIINGSTIIHHCNLTIIDSTVTLNGNFGWNDGYTAIVKIVRSTIKINGAYNFGNYGGAVTYYNIESSTIKNASSSYYSVMFYATAAMNITGLSLYHAEIVDINAPAGSGTLHNAYFKDIYNGIRPDEVNDGYNITVDYYYTHAISCWSNNNLDLVNITHPVGVPTGTIEGNNANVGIAFGFNSVNNYVNHLYMMGYGMLLPHQPIYYGSGGAPDNNTIINSLLDGGTYAAYGNGLFKSYSGNGINYVKNTTFMACYDAVDFDWPGNETSYIDISNCTWQYASDNFYAGSVGSLGMAYKFHNCTIKDSTVNSGIFHFDNPGEQVYEDMRWINCTGPVLIDATGPADSILVYQKQNFLNGYAGINNTKTESTNALLTEAVIDTSLLTYQTATIRFRDYYNEAVHIFSYYGPYVYYTDVVGASSWSYNATTHLWSIVAYASPTTHNGEVTITWSASLTIPPPTNDAISAQSIIITNHAGWVNMTVSTVDVVSNFEAVTIQITTPDGDSFALRWTQITNLFSIVNDTAGICTLNASSTVINLDVNTNYVAFCFQISTVQHVGYCTVVSEVIDERFVYDLDTYANAFWLSYSALIIPAPTATYNIFTGMLGNLISGDIVAFFTTPLNAVFGAFTYLIIIIGMLGAFYIRYRNANIIIFLLILFGGAGGLVGVFVPGVVQIVLWAMLAIGLAGLLFRVFR